MKRYAANVVRVELFTERKCATLAILDSKRKKRLYDR
jgi:hypothetical protein